MNRVNDNQYRTLQNCSLKSLGNKYILLFQTVHMIVRLQNNALVLFYFTILYCKGFGYVLLPTAWLTSIPSLGIVLFDLDIPP